MSKSLGQDTPSKYLAISWNTCTFLLLLCHGALLVAAQGVQQLCNLCLVDCIPNVIGDIALLLSDYLDTCTILFGMVLASAV